MSSNSVLPSKPLHVLSTHSAPINTLCFSSQGGTYILSGSSDRQIHLSRTIPSTSSTNDTGPPSTNSPIQKYSAHGYAILDIAVSADNATFASVGGDRSVFLWDVQRSESTLRRFGSNTTAGHSSRINCVGFAGLGDAVLVSGGDDRSVRLWDVKSRDVKPLMVLEEAKDGVVALFIPPSGVEVVAGSVDGRVRSYDVRMGRVVVDVAAGAVTSLDGTRDGRALLVGCLDGKIRLMDRSDGNCLRAFPADGQEVGYTNEHLRLRSCLAKNESLVLTGSESDGAVRAWDVVSGNLVGKVDVGGKGKVISIVKWREGSVAQERQGVWAAGGAEGVVKIYG